MKALHPAAPSYLCALTLLFFFPLVSQAQTSLYADNAADSDEQRIERILRQRGSIHFVEEPLRDVVAEMGRQFGVQIMLAAKKLEEASVSPDTPITKQLYDLPFESMLRVMLSDLELDFTVRNGVLLITTPEDVESQLQTRVYPVLDLVMARDARNLTAAGNLARDYDALIDLLTTTIAPQAWDDVGGPGSIVAFDNAGVLVLSQTRNVHQQIEGLLTTLRRVKSTPTNASSASRSIGQPLNSYSAGENSRRCSTATVQSWQLPQAHGAAQ